MAKLKNVHPGEVLLEEFRVPMALSRMLSLGRSVFLRPASNEIVLGKRAVTADTALRVATAFGTSEAFWLGVQRSSRDGIGRRFIVS
jgi:addiction module HigA family antidote